MYVVDLRYNIPRQFPFRLPPPYKFRPSSTQASAVTYLLSSTFYHLSSYLTNKSYNKLQAKLPLGL